jgi:D-alanyl-lipoteichoic acid acyltransferase DltB (MBOAT superfamily)
MQIGLMRLIGYEVPERYRYPFLARSPEDFWRRWNTWLGSWAKRYLFYPLALHLRRNYRKLWPVLQQAAAVVATFLFIGLLHDFAAYEAHVCDPANRTASLGVTLLFFAYGLTFVVWVGATRLLVGLFPALSSTRGWKPLVVKVLSWLIFVHYLLFMFRILDWSFAGR